VKRISRREVAKDLIERTLAEEDPDRPIEPGDLCCLKGGGPTMTAREIDGDLVVAEWFDKAQLRTAKFKLHSLRRGPHQRLPIINIDLGDGSDSDRRLPWEYVNKNKSDSTDE
jgi:uncharacterized protein YodC (DUF2158 family)